MSSDSIIEQMEKFKEDFYNREGKNSFFKKTQKLDCAKKISEVFNIEEALRKTIYNIPNTNKLVFDYNVFKFYANPNNYEIVVNYVIQNYDVILSKFQTIEANIILDGFTISAAERYKEAIKLFCAKCMNSTSKYSRLISQMNIYYTPSMIDSISTILKPFIKTDVEINVSFFSKTESPELLKLMFSGGVL